MKPDPIKTSIQYCAKCDSNTKHYEDDERIVCSVCGKIIRKKYQKRFVGEKNAAN